MLVSNCCKVTTSWNPDLSLPYSMIAITFSLHLLFIDRLDKWAKLNFNSESDRAILKVKLYPSQNSYSVFFWPNADIEIVAIQILPLPSYQHLFLILILNDDHSLLQSQSYNYRNDWIKSKWNWVQRKSRSSFHILLMNYDFICVCTKLIHS